MLTQRAACRGVSTCQLRLKATTITDELGITGFRGGPTWIRRFLRCKSLALRARTTMCQKLLADGQDKLVSFRQFVTTTVTDHDVTNDHIMSMEEMPLTFDIPMTTTVERKGSKSVTIQTTGHKKASFTVVLGCCAAGDKLPPMLVFKRKTAIKQKLSSCPTTRKGGWTKNR